MTSKKKMKNKRRNMQQFFRAVTMLCLVVYFLCFMMLAVSSSSTSSSVTEAVDDTTNSTTNSQKDSQEEEDDDYDDITLPDGVEDSLFDPLAMDPSCSLSNSNESNAADCYGPPESTIEEEDQVILVSTKIDTTCFHGGDATDDDEDEVDDEDDGVTLTNEDETNSSGGGNRRATTTTESSSSSQLLDDDNNSKDQKNQQCTAEPEKVVRRVDKHWGSDRKILDMRNKLRDNSFQDPLNDRRPPIFLMPGLASTRLVAWKFKRCNFMSSDIKVQDNVWLNINLVIRMGSIDVDCMSQCLSLGLNQTDVPPDLDDGCKLRPDEGLDAIASLAPGSIGADLLVGGTNTVYAWLIQWLADNMGYDVTNIIGLPYDWRLSPDKMQARDGFLSMTRRRIEAAVSSNGMPGIMVAHSMGNLIFRYFLEWLRVEMREESYADYVNRAERRRKRRQQKQNMQQQQPQQAFIMSESGHSDIDNNFTDDLDDDDDITSRNSKFWELAVHEGDEKWIEWIEKHIWTYVGLSAPMMGAVNPLRSILSGENMGLPISDKHARLMELTFGSTHTVNPVSSHAGFCDSWEDDIWDEETKGSSHGRSFVRKDRLKPDQVGREMEETSVVEYDEAGSKLACLDDIMSDIEFTATRDRDPWREFPTLKSLLRDRFDWTSSTPMIDVDIEHCRSRRSQDNGKSRQCNLTDTLKFGADSVTDRSLFTKFNELWNEPGSPLLVKKEQLEESFYNIKVPNVLNRTWDRPLIKHVIMAYGVDLPTEVGYIYSKKYNVVGNDTENAHFKLVDRNDTEIPHLKTVFWEDRGGQLSKESVEAPRGSIAEVLIKKKPKRTPLERREDSPTMPRSGDGSVPYLSLSWAHTWLLHAARAKRYTEDQYRTMIGDEKNALDHISVSHRPQGEIEWIDGFPEIEVAKNKGSDDVKLDPDTGTDHPHGTRYKPEMLRYHNVGTSRTTGIEYTTTVIEAVGIEHKETTRNYDILAAVFTEVVKYMDEDLEFF